METTGLTGRRGSGGHSDRGRRGHGGWRGGSGGRRGGGGRGRGGRNGGRDGSSNPYPQHRQDSTTIKVAPTTNGSSINYSDNSKPSRKNVSNGSGAKSNGNSNTSISLSEDFCIQVQAELQALVDDGSRQEMSFPACYDNTERRYIHSMAQKFGLFSKSSGKGDARFIHVAKVKKNAQMKEISQLLPSVPMNPATVGAWFPHVVTEYLSRYPIVAESSEEDPWNIAPTYLSMSALLQHRGGKGSHHRRSALPLFNPLQTSEKGSSKKPKATGKAAHPKLSTVSNLPVNSYRSQILELVDANQIVVISGDTGCGKSTQIPQFLLDEAISNGKIDQTRIICTQPRRLSAISLAERVARERNSAIGTEVGHAIRFDSSFDAEKSKLIFCTTGTLLKWLNADPLAHGFSHLILDEVHERDQFTDFLLILLKSSILKQRKDLKVILMSATIQVHKFSDYFQPEYSAPVLEMVGGRCFPVTTLFLEDVLGLLHGHDNGHTSMSTFMGNDAGEMDDSDDCGLTCPMCGGGGFADEDAFGMHVAMCFGEITTAPPKKTKTPSHPASRPSKQPNLELGDIVQASLSGVSDAMKEELLTAYLKQENALARDQSIDYDLLLQLLHTIDRKFPLEDDPSMSNKGAVLVFLPGWEEISYMERALLRSRSTSSKYEIAMLHSRLSAQEQRKAFLTPPRGKRKLILATNIAETSLTIEDVVFVVDCGKSKQAHALATTSSSSFVMGIQTTWVAKANCVQRMGRAGRVRPGICFRLFSRARYETSMKEFMVPELLTTPLEELLLHIKLLQFEKKLQIHDAKEFLLQAMDAPNEVAIDASLQRLQNMNALDQQKGELTLLGWHLGHICSNGVAVQMGKLMLWSNVFGSFDMILRTTCALSGYRDPFISFVGMTSEESRQVEMSKQALLRYASPPFPVHSDHFVLLKALEAYLSYPARSFRDLDTFCDKNMLHRQTLEQLVSIYRQLEREMELLGLSNATQLVPSETNPVSSLAAYFMSLSAGLYPNALFTPTSSTSRNWTSKEKVKVRMESSSVLNWNSGVNKNGGGGSTANGDGARFDWMVYHEMMQSDRTRVAKYGTKLPSLLLPMLLMSNAESFRIDTKVIILSDEAEEQVELRKWYAIVDDWIVFELQTAEEAHAIAALRRRLQAAFYRHLDRLYLSSQHRHQHHHQYSVDQHDPTAEHVKQHDQELIHAILYWISLDLQHSGHQK